jgi:thiol-disulfide isomerase/thioredoxin
VSSTLQIGPMAVPVSLLFMLAALAAATYVGKWTARKRGINVESVLLQTLVVGLVAARLAFVVQFSSSYGSSPLGILDVRDGGWRPAVGFAAAWLYAVGWQFKRPALLTPLLAAVLTGTAIWGGGLLALAAPDSSQELPSMALTTLDGAAVDLAAFRGKPTVVNLWATWCPPCVREMPVLHQAQVSNPAINFVFINQGEGAARVSGWLDARKLLLRNVLLDSRGDAPAAFNQRGLPTTLFFDAEGRLVSIRTGELSAASLADRLKEVSGSQPLP